MNPQKKAKSYAQQIAHALIDNHGPNGFVSKYDNGVLDALTGVMFEDDSQVTQLVARKQYLEKNDETPPFVLIEVMTDD